MTRKIWSIDSARENLEQLLSDAEKNSPQAIQIGSKHFRVSFIGDKDGTSASERLAKGGPLDKDDE